VSLYSAGKIRLAKKAVSGWELQEVGTLDNTLHSGFEIEQPRGCGISISTAFEIDGNDQAYILYGSPLGFNYAYPSGSGWDVQTLSDYSSSVSIALDPAGNPHLVNLYSNYYEPGQLYYYKWMNDTWETTLVDDSKRTGIVPVLVLDADNHPHIAYNDHQTLKYAQFVDGAWDFQSGPHFDVLDGLDLALDSSEYPHISLTKGNSFSSDANALVHAYWNGVDWDIQTVMTETLRHHTSLSLDSNEQPHIAVCGADDQLLYSVRTETGWDTQIVDQIQYCQSTPDLALDSLDVPHIGYCHPESESLRLASLTVTGWVTQTVDDQAGGDSSLVFDSVGYPHIAYAADDILKYAFWTGTEWYIQVAALDTFFGDISLALDGADFPHIAYDHASTSSLPKHVYWSGSAWIVSTVEQRDIAGYSPSLAIDSDGNPHIAYHDNTNQDLMYVLGVPASYFTFMPLTEC
jgi:hypothetical protein